MSEVNEKDKVSMSMKVPKQVLHVFKAVSGFKAAYVQDVVWKLAYDGAINYLKEEGLLETIKKEYSNRELEEWDNEL
jgi:hypothetical protein